jgi:hypothetical protein
MAKSQAQEEAKVAGQIIITMYEDPSKAFNVSITGDWRPAHILAVERSVIKANRIKRAAERLPVNEADNKES